MQSTGRKHGQSLEAMGHGFYCLIAKRSLQKQGKDCPKITVRPIRLTNRVAQSRRVTDRQTDGRTSRESIVRAMHSIERLNERARQT